MGILSSMGINIVDEVRNLTAAACLGATLVSFNATAEVENTPPPEPVDPDRYAIFHKLDVKVEKKKSFLV